MMGEGNHFTLESTTKRKYKLIHLYLFQFKLFHGQELQVNTYIAISIHTWTHDDYQ